MFAFVAACTASTTGEPGELSSDVVGGTVVAAGDAIAQRTVFFTPASSKGRAGCTATILDSAHALTAQHCVRAAEGVTDFVLLFARKWSDSAPTRPVTAMKGYAADPFDDHDDIAVLTFSGGLPSGFVPVTLPKDLVLKVGTAIIQAGFGVTTLEPKDGGDDGRGVLRSVATTLHAIDTKVHEISFQSPGHTICSGDSGGPDFVNVKGALVQVGVHSTGNCEGAADSADVRAYDPWIQTQLSH
jgi:secreted trypsin-like serine protease